MEVIEVGNKPVEEVIDFILKEDNFRRLAGHYQTACFVLAHQMHSRNFYSQLIENTDTIDATTREFLAFIVFYGNRSSIVKEKYKGDYRYGEKIRLNGLSTSTETEFLMEKDDDSMDTNIRFSQELGEQLRFEDDPINQKALSQYMTRASTTLMEKYGVNDSNLPCLLFVNPNNIEEKLIVHIDPNNPVDSLYHQILKPLSLNFYNLSQYWEKLNGLKYRPKNLKEALEMLKTEPKEMEELKLKLNEKTESIEKIKIRLDDVRLRWSNVESKRYSIQAEEANDYFDKGIFSEFKDLGVEDHNIEGLIISIAENVKSLENLKKKASDIEHGIIEFNSEAQKKLEVSHATERLNKSRRGLEDRMDELIDRIKNISRNISRRVSEVIAPVYELESKIRSLKFQIEGARKTVANDSFDKISADEKGLLETEKVLLKKGFSSNLLSAGHRSSFEIVKILHAHGEIGFMKHDDALPMKDVFICHASEDKKEFIEPLVKALQEVNVSCWYDNAEIKWGDSIVKKVNQGLLSSRFVLVALSRNSIRKHWPNNELEASLNQEFSSGKIKVLPLLIGSEMERKEIMKSYPILGAKLYLIYSLGLNEIVSALQDRLRD